ncbi:MAG TPA: adenosylcobinamide-GDP ribazoletransferase [Candidatus Dormibacteraeota bacterium]|nr:adenosylcobinamide-GDP ribazoletransferase [Candidatus Dormibacteraeota bacterium]
MQTTAAGSRAAPWQALGALGLLSVIPIPRRAHGLPGALTLAAFAPAGLLLGGVLAGLEVGLAPVLPLGARSAVLLAALVALSGAMHVDGLMDSADGLFGGRDRDRRLEIMRDSRAGAFGVAAAIAVVLVQYSALASLSGGRVQALVAAVGLSRAVSAFALGIAPPARVEGLGSVFTVHRRGRGGTVALAIAAGVAVWLCGWRGLAAAGVSVAVALGVVAVFRRRVGGMTGDGFGATIELALAGTLLCLVAR